MPVSGVVVVLDPDPVAARAAMDALARQEGVTLGSVPDPRRVPITIESDDVREVRETQRRIEALPGVYTVEVAFVDFGSPAIETAHNGEDAQ